MRSYWFGDVVKGGCIPSEGDTDARVRRVLSLRTTMVDFVPLDWEDAVACGICRDRKEYLSFLREICFAATELEIREQYAGKDVELLQMVRTLDEMDELINRLSDRVTEWHQVRNP